jgi:prepilin-type N-terminal cleavage/methylation domain-containing protein
LLAGRRAMPILVMQTMFKRRKLQQGVNLIELVVAMSIAALSLTVGVPAFVDLRVSSDRSSALIELVAAAKLARSEAALRGQAVSVCASANGASCSNSNNWSTGWIVFRDPDRDLVVGNSAADIIKVVRFDNPRFTIASDRNINGGITFSLFGFTTPTSGIFSYKDAQTARTVQLTYIGRLHILET